MQHVCPASFSQAPILLGSHAMLLSRFGVRLIAEGSEGERCRKGERRPAAQPASGGRFLAGRACRCDLKVV